MDWRERQFIEDAQRIKNRIGADEARKLANKQAREAEHQAMFAQIFTARPGDLASPSRASAYTKTPI